MNKHKLISIDLAKNVFQVRDFTKNNEINFNKNLAEHGYQVLSLTKSSLK